MAETPEVKVLIVHPQMALYGGAELVVVRLARHLLSRGHSVSILTLAHSPHPDYTDLNFILPPKQTEYRIRGNSIRTALEIPKLIRDLGRMCREEAGKYDVINAHNFPSMWAIPEGTKIVWMCNEIPDLWHNTSLSSFIDRSFFLARKIDATVVKRKKPTVVVADKSQAQLFYYRYGIQPHIIPYGVDGTFFSRPSRISLPPSFTLLHPAMISPSKNQMAVLKAIRSLDGTRATFAGYSDATTPYLGELQEYAKAKGLEEKVLFAGHVDRAALRDLYNASHVAVFPGRGQGSWLGPFEALAASKPIIVSPSLSCSSLIREKNIGTISDDLATSIYSIQSHYSHYKQQALRGQQFVLDELTWKKFCTKFEEVLIAAAA